MAYRTNRVVAQLRRGRPPRQLIAPTSTVKALELEGLRVALTCSATNLEQLTLAQALTVTVSGLQVSA